MAKSLNSIEWNLITFIVIDFRALWKCKRTKKNWIKSAQCTVTSVRILSKQEKKTETIRMCLNWIGSGCFYLSTASCNGGIINGETSWKWIETKNYVIRSISCACAFPLSWIGSTVVVDYWIWKLLHNDDVETSEKETKKENPAHPMFEPSIEFTCSIASASHCISFKCCCCCSCPSVLNRWVVKFVAHYYLAVWQFWIVFHIVQANKVTIVRGN